MGFFGRGKKKDDFDDFAKGMGNGGMNDPFSTGDNFMPKSQSESYGKYGDPSLDFASNIQNPQSFGDPFGGEQSSSFEGGNTFPGRGSDPSRPFPSQSLGPQQQPAQQPQQIQKPGNIEKDIELLSVKLDNLRNLMENINQRLINIENIAREEQKKSNTW